MQLKGTAASEYYTLISTVCDRSTAYGRDCPQGSSLLVISNTIFPIIIHSRPSPKVCKVEI